VTWLLAARALFGTALGWVRAIPWQVWAFAAVVALAMWHGHRRERAGYERAIAECITAQRAADAALAAIEIDRLAKAEATAQEAQTKAQEATTGTRVETAKAVERVKHETARIDTSNCTALPDRVRDEGRQAVERARAAVGKV
jgi:hypothetical protein